MTADVNRELEAAIRRAFSLGRVDCSIQVAADQLFAMASAMPDLIPETVLRLYDLEPSRRFRLPDWDEALWAVADRWCEIYRGLHGRPERQPPASPYSILEYEIPQPKATPPPQGTKATAQPDRSNRNTFLGGIKGDPLNFI